MGRVGVGLLVALVCAALASAAANAPLVPTFGAPVALPPTQPAGGASLQEIATGDVTGDGRADVVIAHIQFNSPAPAPLQILAGDGHGGFSDQTTQIFGGPPPGLVWPACAIVLADFNGDGRPDILVANTGFDQEPFAGGRNTLALSAPGGKLVGRQRQPPRGERVQPLRGRGGRRRRPPRRPLRREHLLREAPPEILLNDVAPATSYARAAPCPRHTSRHAATSALREARSRTSTGRRTRPRARGDGLAARPIGDPVD